MRLVSFCGHALAVAILVSGSAAFAAGPQTKEKGTSSGLGAGSPTPSGAPETSANTSDEQHGGTSVRGELSEEGRAGRDIVLKPWEVGVELETHRLIRQTDLQGQAADKVANFLGVYGQYDLTEYDRIGLRWGASQRFIADANETGIRGDDVAAFYTRFVPLPGRVLLRATAQLTAPTSFYSKKAGLITAPRVSIAADRRFGDFILSARVTGDAFIVKYDTTEGGAPNPKWRLGAYLAAEYRMPFLPELAVGVDVTSQTLWYQEVQAGANPNVQADPQFSSQPTQQAYGGEVFVRYLLPTLVGIRSDILFAFAQGDPALGFTSYLHDGVGHVYPFFRESTEIYLALSARY